MRRPVLVALLLGVATGGAAAQARGRLTDRGLDSLRAAVQVDSVDAEAYYRLGLGLWEKRKYDQADTAFQRALHFQPWHAGAHLALGALPFGRGGRYRFDLPGRVGADSARAIYRGAALHTRLAYLYDPAVDLTPLRFLSDDELVPDGGGRVACGEGGCVFYYRDPKWVRPVRRAYRLLVTGQADSAYALLMTAYHGRQAAEIVPDEFVWSLALAADRTGHAVEAADGYRELAQRATRRERAAAIDPTPQGRDLFLMLYGLASDRAGQTAVARAALREALVADLTLFQAHVRLADLAEMAGAVDEAVTERHRAITAAPGIARLYTDLGVTLLQAGRTAEARDAFTEAVIRAPYDPAAQLFLFQAAVTLGDRGTAERAMHALELFAPRRNRDQVADARQRLAALP